MVVFHVSTFILQLHKGAIYLLVHQDHLCTLPGKSQGRHCTDTSRIVHTGNDCHSVF